MAGDSQRRGALILRAGWHVLLQMACAVGGALLTVALGWSLWFAIAWACYGHTPATSASDTLIDRFMQLYEVAERHAIRVAAPAAITYDAARSIDLERSGVVHAIFAGRHRLFSQTGAAVPHLALGDLQSMGWGLLAEVPGRELVFGAITQPWRRDVRFRALPSATFASFDSAGYAKIVWTLAVDSIGHTQARFYTETRVVTTDALSRARFRRYWALLSPGILLIRWQAIRLVRADAERRFRATVFSTRAHP